jgi:seryl-tRNA(Sec) selenium transferase
MFKSLEEVQEMFDTESTSEKELMKIADENGYILNYEEASGLYVVREKEWSL